MMRQRTHDGIVRALSAQWERERDGLMSRVRIETTQMERLADAMKLRHGISVDPTTAASVVDAAIALIERVPKPRGPKAPPEPQARRSRGGKRA